MIPLRLVTLAGDPEREASLAGLLTRRDDVELVLRCVDRIELLASIRGADLDAVVSVGSPSWLDRPAAAELAGARVRLVGVVDDPLDAEMLAGLGASLVPATAGVDAVVERCGSSQITAPSSPPEAEPSSGGSLIAVWGPKGAPGRTTVAVELAAELAAHEPSTLLIDADAYGGDIAQLLAVVDELPTVLWAAQEAAKDRLGGHRLESELRRAGPSGPVLLPGIPRPDLWDDISEFGWRQLLKRVRGTFRFTVCDTGFCLEPTALAQPEGEGRNRTARITVGACDQLVAVCRADPVGIKNFVWAFEELKELTDPGEVFIVANQVAPGEEREVGEVLRRYLGRAPVCCIPVASAFATATKMGAPLRTLQPGSAAASALRRLAAAVGADLPARGLLSRLAGRR